MEQTITFKDLPLKETLLKSIEERGFTTPTEIQQKAIPLLAQNDVDFVGQAQTGTGKTAAFSLPLLNKLDTKSKSIQSIVLSPTRELANQICDEMKKFMIHEKAKVLSVYGGTSIENQIKDLRRLRPSVVVGTPGRVLDLLKRGVLKLQDAKIAILDEADEMLDMGFIDDVKEILSYLPEEKNTWMFSATMPPAILDLIKNYLNNPEVIKIKKKTLSNENITQQYFLVQPRHMNEAVCRILDSLDDYYGIIFTRTKMDARNLTEELNERGFPTDSLHGDMDQKHRDITMKKFKKKHVKLLVCTDVAARGIDVDHLTHVINFGLPQDLESYVHRIGRTGRAGQKGMALSIIDPSEQYRLRQIERMTKAQISEEKLPSIEVLKDAMVKRTIGKFEKVFEYLEKGDEMEESFSLFKDEFDHLDSDQLLKVMYTYIFKQSMDKLNANAVIEGRSKERTGGRNAGTSLRGHTRFFVNVGREDGVSLKGLISDIARTVNIAERNIKNVSLKDKFSFIEVPDNYMDAVLSNRELVVNNRQIKFEVSKAPAFADSRRSGGRSGRGRGGRPGSGRGNFNRSRSGNRSDRRGGERRNFNS